MSEVVVPLLVQAAIALGTPIAVRLAGARPGPFHPAVAFALPYALITTGPAIRYLVFGVTPYGIHLDMLAQALGVACMAQAGILAGCVLGARWPHVPQRYVALRRPLAFRRLLLCAFAASLALAVVSLGARWGELTTIGKLDAGASSDLWVRVHYAVSLILLALLPAIVVVDQRVDRRILPRRSQIAVGAFGLLCLLEGERDVALALLMVPIAWSTAGVVAARRRRVGMMRQTLRACAAFAVAAVLLVGLEWARSGGALSWSAQVSALGERAREESIVQSVLGLGSNLFVTSRVVEWVPREIPYRWGETYLHTTANLVPSFLLPEFRFESLLTWFKERYAPTSTTGYGFGMEAEAYLNFGHLGPLLVFALWSFGLCRLHDGARRLPQAVLYRYAFTFMVPFSLYCIRGDSLMWAKGFLYAAGIVWVLARVAGVRRLVRRTVVPHRAVPSAPRLAEEVAA